MTQCDDVVVILLQEEGEVVGEAGQEVVLRPEGFIHNDPTWRSDIIMLPEGAVQLEPQQLGPDGGDHVVGEGEARDLEVVLPRQVQHVVTVLSNMDKVEEELLIARSSMS